MSTTFFTATPEQIRRSRCRASWEAGDFGIVAPYSEAAAAEFMGRLELRPGSRFLDLACGTGNLAVLAARAGCRTHGVDVATNLIAQARARAVSEGLSIQFVEGDAESLPYAEGSFDLVASMFGVMFAPHPERAMAELIRVCRPGATIALANWTSEGIIGATLRVVGQHVAPQPGAVSPLLWGAEDSMRHWFAGRATHLECSRRIARLRFPFTAGRTVDFLRQFYGPILRAFAALDSSAQSLLRCDLEALFERHNGAGDGVTQIDAEYLEVVARVGGSWDSAAQGGF